MANTGRNIQTLNLEVCAGNGTAIDGCNIFVNMVGTLRRRHSIRPGLSLKRARAEPTRRETYRLYDEPPARRFVVQSTRFAPVMLSAGAFQ